MTARPIFERTEDFKRQVRLYEKIPDSGNGIGDFSIYEA